MRRILALVILLTFIPRTASADQPLNASAPSNTVQPLVPVPPGDDVIVVVKKDDPAPFAGQLFDPSTALRWANYLQQYKFRLQADVQLQQRLDQAEIDYQKKVLQIEQDKYNKVTLEQADKIQALQQEVDHPPFYKTTWFGIVVGVVAMGTAVGLAAWGLYAVK